MTDDRLYLTHILECIARIEQYVTGGEQVFRESSLVQDAVLRNLQTLAESTQRLSADLKADHPGIEWQGLTGFRNVLVHDYLGVDLEYCWRLIKHKLPELKRSLADILEELGRRS